MRCLKINLYDKYFFMSYNLKPITNTLTHQGISMLSVRLPKSIERDLNQFCSSRQLTKSHVVQEALAEYMVAAKSDSTPKSAPAPDLSFLDANDPIRQFIGIAKDGPSTDEWLAITRGDEWNKP